MWLDLGPVFHQGAHLVARRPHPADMAIRFGRVVPLADQVDIPQRATRAAAPCHAACGRDHQLTLDNPLGEPGALHRRRVGDAGSHYLITFTMWAMTSAAMRRAIADCSIMVILAHRLVGNVSVGLNAVALVNARYR